MTGQMICQNCGTQIEEGMSFCPKCGMKVCQGQQFQNQMPSQGSYFSATNVNVKKKDSVLSIISFLVSFIGCGVFSLIGGILGVIDIIIGNKKKDRSKRYSVAAVVISVCLSCFAFSIFGGSEETKNKNTRKKVEENLSLIHI